MLETCFVDVASFHCESGAHSSPSLAFADLLSLAERRMLESLPVVLTVEIGAL